MGTAAWVSGLSTQWRPVADADWCVGSKRARALRALRRPPHRRRLCRCVWLGASSRSPARPRRRPRAPQPTGSIAWPSRSCGALHAGRANPLRGRWDHGSRWCHAQSADHLGEKRWKRAVMGEVVCVLGTSVPVI